MASWDRDTPWRQGNVVPHDVAVTLELLPQDALDSAVAIVISHDCDLAQPPNTEPHVEMIVGRMVKSVDGNFTYAKNARRLHLTLSGGTSSLSLDLLATGKILFEKVRLADYEPLGAVRLTPSEGVILQRWLAARYRRSAFPDEFDSRLEKTGVHERISKTLKAYGDMIAAVYFDVDQGRDVRKSGPDDVYTLGINLLYSTETDPEKAELAANTAKIAIEKVFQDRCFTKASKTWHDIELVWCEAISDQAMTVQQAELLKRWSADHISLRADPTKSMLNDG